MVVVCGWWLLGIGLDRRRFVVGRVLHLVLVWLFSIHWLLTVAILRLPVLGLIVVVVHADAQFPSLVGACHEIEVRFN